MSLKLNIEQHLMLPSDRVKCIDLYHPEQWMLCALHNGHVLIINYQTLKQIKDIPVSTKPVRCARFIVRQNIAWIITGADDGYIRIFDLKTFEEVYTFQGHSDFVRSIAVHPKLSLVLTCSDDNLIKLWNWEKKWSCDRVFEGHTHYVMQIVFNPQDLNIFASASLDRTVKVWQLDSNVANFTLEGHTKGVNCVNYYHSAGKAYLVSGGDDSLAKIWDCQNKTCVQILEGHTDNITAVTFHNHLPIALTGSEDGTVRVWQVDFDKQTHYLKSSNNYDLKRVWTIANNNADFALGFDEGCIMIKVQQE